MDDPQGCRQGEPEDYIDEIESAYANAFRKPNRTRGERKHKRGSSSRRKRRDRSREAKVESRDGTFRCRRCKTIVGIPISGGRHRNHCPLCLYSRHVDKHRPGDRLETCRSMMRPVGVSARSSGEQVLVHECLGCGVERHNRIAADDNVLAVMRLRVLDPESVRRVARAEERPA